MPQGNSLYGINLNSLTGDSQINNLDEENQQFVSQITVGEVCVPLKEIFYLTDMCVMNKKLAQKLRKANLSGSFIMVRSEKEKEFDSSE